MADQRHQDDSDVDPFASPDQAATSKIDRPRTPATSKQSSDSDTTEERAEAREKALRRELEGVRNINEAIEGVIRTLERAKGNMQVSNTLTSFVVYYVMGKNTQFFGGAVSVDAIS